MNVTSEMASKTLEHLSHKPLGSPTPGKGNQSVVKTCEHLYGAKRFSWQNVGGHNSALSKPLLIKGVANILRAYLSEATRQDYLW